MRSPIILPREWSEQSGVDPVVDHRYLSRWNALAVQIRREVVSDYDDMVRQSITESLDPTKYRDQKRIAHHPKNDSGIGNDVLNIKYKSRAMEGSRNESAKHEGRRWRHYENNVVLTRLDEIWKA